MLPGFSFFRSSSCLDRVSSSSVFYFLFLIFFLFFFCFCYGEVAILTVLRAANRRETDRRLLRRYGWRRWIVMADSWGEVVVARELMKSERVRKREPVNLQWRLKLWVAGLRRWGWRSWWLGIEKIEKWFLLAPVRFIGIERVKLLIWILLEVNFSVINFCLFWS